MQEVLLFNYITLYSNNSILISILEGFSINSAYT